MQYKIDSRWLIGYNQGRIVLIDSKHEKKSRYLSFISSLCIWALTEKELENEQAELLKQGNTGWSLTDTRAILMYTEKIYNDFLVPGQETRESRKIVKKYLHKGPVSYRSDYKLDYPVILTWIPTWKCNNQCVYCCIPHILPDDCEKQIALETVQHAIVKAIDEGVQELHIHGGEPLTYGIEKIESVVRYAVERGVIVSLSTKNKINQKLAERLKGWGIKEIQLSLDTSNKETAEKLKYRRSYLKDFEESVRALKKTEIDIQINIVITKINITDIPELLDYLKQFKVNSIYLSNYRPHAEQKENLSISIDQSEKLRTLVDNGKWSMEVVYSGNQNSMCADDRPICDGGRNGLVVFPDGHVGICDQLSTMKFSVGSVADNNIQEIWNALPSGNIQYFDALKIFGTKCEKCKYIQECDARGRCIPKILLSGEKGPDFICMECRE